MYTISYSGATTGTNEKISAMIVNSEGVATYYGVLCDAKTGENTVTVDVSGKLGASDKLYVFNEQVNGNYKTDFSSALVDVTPKVMPDLTVNKADLKTDLNTTDARTIWYGGSKWRVIGYDGAGAASESGTMTLFADGNMGTSYFDFDGKTGKQYSGSDLEKQTNQIYNNAFSDPEQLAVRDRTLNAGTYDGANTDGVQGSSVGYARLWPLSTKEANAVNDDLRKDTGAWWLRSPGDGVNNVAFVKKEGDVDHIGQSFLSSSGVRPAFHVDLDKVIFASAAVGGVTGAAGRSAGDSSRTVISSKSASPCGVCANRSGAGLTGTGVFAGWLPISPRICMVRFCMSVTLSTVCAPPVGGTAFPVGTRVCGPVPGTGTCPLCAPVPGTGTCALCGPVPGTGTCLLCGPGAAVCCTPIVCFAVAAGFLPPGCGFCRAVGSNTKPRSPCFAPAAAFRPPSGTCGDRPRGGGAILAGGWVAVKRSSGDWASPCCERCRSPSWASSGLMASSAFCSSPGLA